MMLKTKPGDLRFYRLKKVGCFQSFIWTPQYLMKKSLENVGFQGFLSVYTEGSILFITKALLLF